MVDDDRAWTHAPPAGTRELTGLLREQTVLDRFTVTLGDWRRHYRLVDALEHLRDGDGLYLMVRVVPAIDHAEIGVEVHGRTFSRP